MVSGHRTIEIWRRHTGKHQFLLPPSHRCDFCYCLFNIPSTLLYIITQPSLSVKNMLGGIAFAFQMIYVFLEMNALHQCFGQLLMLRSMDKDV